MELTILKKYVANKVIEIYELETSFKNELSLQPNDQELNEIINEFFSFVEKKMLSHLENLNNKNIIFTNIEDCFHFVVSTQYLMHQYIGFLTIFKSLQDKDKMDFIGFNLEKIMKESDKIVCNFDVINNDYEKQAILFLNDYALKNNIKNEDLKIDFFKQIIEKF